MNKIKFFPDTAPRKTCRPADVPPRITIRLTPPLQREYGQLGKLQRRRIAARIREALPTIFKLVTNTSRL